MNDKPEAVALKPCPSCDGLNISCPNGCGRDPKTGELNGTLYAHPPSQDASALVAALRKVRKVAQSPNYPGNNLRDVLTIADAALTAWEAQHG